MSHDPYSTYTLRLGFCMCRLSVSVCAREVLALTLNSIYILAIISPSFTAKIVTRTSEAITSIPSIQRSLSKLATNCQKHSNTIVERGHKYLSLSSIKQLILLSNYTLNMYLLLVI